MEAFYPVLEPMELSAEFGYTTKIGDDTIHRAVGADTVHTIKRHLHHRRIEALPSWIGKIQAAVRRADYIIGTVEALVIPAVGQDGIRAIRFHTRHLTIDHFTDNHPSLPVEGHAIGFTALLADNFRGMPWHQFDDLTAADIDEQEVAIRMPQGTFGKHETRGQSLRLR
jgi:hypothetical protein